MNDEPQVDYDPNLWVELDHCAGKHYILGNPHTFPGRIWMWCPHKEVSFFMSKGDVLACSREAEYWLKGFLSGNEPGPPLGEDQMPSFDSPEYSQWQERIEDFHARGVWTPGKESK